jgi:hypothetical protein
MTEIDQSEHVLFDFEVTEAIYLRFWSFSSFKGVNPTLKKSLILGAWLIAGPSLIIFNLIYYGLVYGNYLYLLNLWDWLIALIPLGGMFFFLNMVFLGGKKLYRKYPQMRIHYSYDFGQEGFYVSSVSEFASSHSEINYTLLTKAYETKDAFYLFLHNKTAYIVDKSSLIQGNLTSMRLNLQKTLKRNFILCK